MRRRRQKVSQERLFLSDALYTLARINFHCASDHADTGVWRDPVVRATDAPVLHLEPGRPRKGSDPSCEPGRVVRQERGADFCLCGRTYVQNATAVPCSAVGDCRPAQLQTRRIDECVKRGRAGCVRRGCAIRAGPVTRGAGEVKSPAVNAVCNRALSVPCLAAPSEPGRPLIAQTRPPCREQRDFERRPSPSRLRTH